MFFWKYRLGDRRLMDQAKEGDQGGGGGDKGKVDDAAKALADSLAENASLKERLAALEAKAKPAPDLKDKADDHRKEQDKKQSDSKSLEAALTFNLGSAEFLKSNAALLPKNVGDIFTVAEKERYDSAVEKASDIKAGLIHSFFSVQDNLNLLTATQKATLEDYLKLTKNGRQENAQSIYSSIFEPTLEMLKRVKKAEEVNRSRNGLGDGSDEAYKQKLIGLSKSHYLGERK